MSYRHPNIHKIHIVLLLTIGLNCCKTINLQKDSGLTMPARLDGVNAALKQYNKHEVINVCLIPIWFGENTREFISDSCNCKISDELKSYGIKTKSQEIKLESDNNNYEIIYWSSYKATMDSLIGLEFGTNFIDSLCLTTKNK
jgi:hypothetical protein